MQKLNGGYSYVTCYKIAKTELKKFDIATCKEPKETLGSFYNRQYTKPTIVTNGGFFGMSGGHPCFNLLDENIAKAYATSYRWGIGVTEDDNDVVYGSLDTIDFKDFISGYPCLVDNGKPLPITYGKEVDGRNPRTLLGVNKDYVFIVAVDGRRSGKPGMNFAQCARLMISFGCTSAINLDGGGSTRMLYKGKVVNNPTENRPVDNVIAIYLKGNDASTPAPNPKPTTPTVGKTYTVKSGDSLWKIAQKEMGNGTLFIKLARYNGINPSDSISVGQVLKIPGTTSSTNPPNYITYSVVRGDSLSKISLKFLGSVNRYKEIMEFNNLSSTTIRVGQILKIPK